VLTNFVILTQHSGCIPAPQTKTEEAKDMNQDFNLFAEALVFVHGTRAESEAALHAALCEKSGDHDTAETWRRLQRAVEDVRRDCERRRAA
jgi:hypothetical protein